MRGVPKKLCKKILSDRVLTFTKPRQTTATLGMRGTISAERDEGGSQEGDWDSMTKLGLMPDFRLFYIF